MSRSPGPGGADFAAGLAAAVVGVGLQRADPRVLRRRSAAGRGVTLAAGPAAVAGLLVGVFVAHRSAAPAGATVRSATPASATVRCAAPAVAGRTDTVSGNATVGAGQAAALAVVTAGLAGFLDDLGDGSATTGDGARPDDMDPTRAPQPQSGPGRASGLRGAGGPGAGSGASAIRGLRGHLGAMRAGRLTTGVVKILVIGAGSVAAAAALPRPTGVAVPPRPSTRGEAVAEAGPGGPRSHRSWSPGGRRTGQLLVDAALIAGTANLVNLFDTRPGRAGKVALLLGLVAGTPPGIVGVLAATLPGDLGERWMLGDTGANALGAALGVQLAGGRRGAARVGWLALVVGLTLASEGVSFGAVIERYAVLRSLDRLGRR